MVKVPIKWTYSSGKLTVASRIMKVFSFGVFNCDRILREQPAEPVLASFVDEYDREIEPKRTYVLRNDVNSVMNYTNASSLNLNRNGDYTIVLILDGEKVALVHSSEIRGRKLKSKNQKIRTSVIDLKGRSVQEVVNLMLS